MSKISTLVSKATSDNREQTPGFILQELATKTQSIEDCRVLEELILSKLQKDKPYIKYKTLKVIKYLCENGAPRWKQSWQSHTDKIRACAQFRGPPDAVYGDSPYENVRQAAKEAMSAVFASTQKVGNFGDRITGQEGPKTATFGNGSQGITNINTSHIPIGRAPVVSNNPQGSQGGGGGSHTKPYNPSHIRNSGFGNTEYKPKATIPFQQHKQQAPYVNPNTFTTEYPHADGKLKNQVSRGNIRRRKGQVGGEWENENGNSNSGQNTNKDENHNSDEELAPDSSDNPRSISGSGSMRQQTVTDGAFERQWVNSITTAGGIGDKIPDLKQKVQQFQNLSQSHVLEFLDEKLADNSSWQVQAKALTLIEGLLNDVSAPMVAEYFRASPENLQGLAHAKKLSLKKKASTIAQRIGLGIPTESKMDNKRESSTGVEEDAKDDVLQLDSWLSGDVPSQDINSNQNTLEPEAEEPGIFDGLETTNNANLESDEIFSGLNVNNAQESFTEMDSHQSTISYTNPSSGGFNFTSSSNHHFGPSQPSSGLNFGNQSSSSSFGNQSSGFGNQPSGFGNQPSGFGNQPSSFGNQLNNNFGQTNMGFGLSQSNNNNTHGSSGGAFASLFTSQDTTTPASNSTSSNMLFMNDPFASVTSQSTPSQQTSKSKKTGDKDPFAEFALGALQI